MDLELTGKIAFVCASSAGLGKACALSLAAEGCEVFINGRDLDRLESAAVEIQAATGRRPGIVVGDIDTATGRSAALAACPDPDILVCNTGGPRPGRMEDWDEAVWSEALAARMTSPILLIQSMVGGMRARGFGRIVVITSAMVTAPKLAMALSAGPRAGLTAFCKGLSQELARDGITVNCILPERVATQRLADMTAALAHTRGIDFESARRAMLKPVPMGRFGRAEEVGDACAFLCSGRAGYITGQNLHLDGGAYPGLV